jgi:hypothetical protein
MAQGLTTVIVTPTKADPSALVRATCFKGVLTIAYDHGHNAEANHRAGALALLQHLRWGGHWVGGSVQGRVGQSKVAFCYVPGTKDQPLSVHFERGFDAEPADAEDEAVDLFS